MGGAASASPCLGKQPLLSSSWLSGTDLLHDLGEIRLSSLTLFPIRRRAEKMLVSYRAANALLLELVSFCSQMPTLQGLGGECVGVSGEGAFSHCFHHMLTVAQSGRAWRCGVTRRQQWV